MQAFAACEPTRVMRGLSHVRVRLDHLWVAGHEVGDLRPRRDSPRPRRVHGEARSAMIPWSCPSPPTIGLASTSSFRTLPRRP
jgi:hypothetical protein